MATLADSRTRHQSANPDLRAVATVGTAPDGGPQCARSRRIDALPRLRLLKTVALQRLAAGQQTPDLSLEAGSDGPLPITRRAKRPPYRSPSRAKQTATNVDGLAQLVRATA